MSSIIKTALLLIVCIVFASAKLKLNKKSNTQQACSTYANGEACKETNCYWSNSRTACENWDTTKAPRIECSSYTDKDLCKTTGCYYKEKISACINWDPKYSCENDACKRRTKMEWREELYKAYGDLLLLIFDIPN